MKDAIKAAIAAAIPPHRRHPRGFSIVQVMLGLALAGVVTAGAIGAYTLANDRAKTTNTGVLISQIRSNINSMTAGRPNLGAANADLVASLIARDLIPDRALAGTQVQHPFGGRVFVQVGTATNRFWIALNNVDQGTCNEIGDAFTDRTTAASGVASIAVAAAPITTWTEPAAGANREATPVTRAELEAICDNFTGDEGMIAIQFAP